MSGAKNNTEGSIEQNDDKDIQINITTDNIGDVIKNEIVVEQNQANSPQGG